MKTALNIAVIGCGIGGMAAATFLARDGHHVSLFERFSNPGPVGSGLMIQPTGQAILDRLGVLDQLKQLAQPIHLLKGKDAYGAMPLNLDYRDLDPQWCGFGVHRSVLFNMLFDVLKTEELSLHFGCEVLGRTPTGEGRWRLRLDAGLSDEEFDLVVDSAGVGSSLHEAEPKRNVEFVYGAVWSTLWLEGFETNCLTQRHRGAWQMLGLLPMKTAPDAGLTGDPFAMFWSLKASQMDGWTTRFNEWISDDVQPLWPEVADAIADQLTAHSFQAARYRDIGLTKFVEPGLAHIGDSAHATSPQLGQGGNLALVDAHVLTQCIESEASLEHALARYDNVRRPLVHLYQQFSRVCTPMFQSDNALFGTLRNLGFPLAMRIAPIRKTMNRVMAGVQTGWLPWQHKPVNDIVSLNP